jgi:ribonuclease VapC
MSAVSYVEAAVVVDGNRDPILSRRLDDLLRDVEIGIEPVTLNQGAYCSRGISRFWQGPASRRAEFW